MRGIVIARIVFACLLLSTASWAAGAPPAGTVAAKRKPARDGWPETPTGTVARQWVEAFSTGEDAMRAFLKQNVSKENLEKRNIPQRIEKYQTMREEYGKLMLTSVTKEAKGELTVSLMAEDASSHTFVFKVDPAPPYKLQSVSIVQKGFSHGGGMFHH